MKKKICISKSIDWIRSQWRKNLHVQIDRLNQTTMKKKICTSKSIDWIRDSIIYSDVNTFSVSEKLKTVKECGYYKRLTTVSYSTCHTSASMVSFQHAIVSISDNMRAVQFMCVRHETGSTLPPACVKHFIPDDWVWTEFKSAQINSRCLCAKAAVNL